MLLVLASAPLGMFPQSVSFPNNDIRVPQTCFGMVRRLERRSLIGGWTSLRMVERYCHVTDEELQRAVRLASNNAAGTSAGTAAAESRVTSG
jgi:hypothetical protein